MKRTYIAVGLLLLLGLSQVASAGIIRHVVKPVVKHGAKATKSVVSKAVHGAKIVVY